MQKYFCVTLRKVFDQCRAYPTLLLRAGKMKNARKVLQLEWLYEGDKNLVNKLGRQ